MACMPKHLLDSLLAWYQHALETGGYSVVGLLMVMESSVMPLPSESIIPLAASWSHTGKIHLSLAGIVLAGAAGSWLGASLVYWLARLAGRPFLLRFGRMILISPDKIQKAEVWSAHYGSAGVFIARLLPGARQLVGIPAGITKFNYWRFSLFTLAGSAIWCSVLCALGVKIGADISKGQMHEVIAWVGGTVLALGGLYYFFVHRQVSRSKQGCTTSGKSR